MDITSFNLLLADDDPDDRILFEEALKELPFTSYLKTVSDGEQLMDLLTTTNTLPDALFLDLNMPRKNGFECLLEIKEHKQLRKLRVFIYSTSLNQQVANQLYDNGAQHYIRKPGDFPQLKKVIFEALTIISKNDPSDSSKDNFVIEV